MNRSELMGVFLSEAEELLQLLEIEILNLEQQGDSPQIIHNIFRIAHTLKGSSAAMGFEEIKQLTHEMENIFDKIRNQLLPVTQQVVDILFQCLDHLNWLKREIEQEGVTKTNIDSIVHQLRQLEKRTEENFESNSKLFEDKKQKLKKWRCKVRLSEHCEMKLPRAHIVLNHLKKWGSVMSSEPELDSVIEETNLNEISYIVKTNADSDALQHLLSQLIDVEDAEVVPFSNDNLVDAFVPLTDANKDSEPDNPIPNQGRKEEKKIGQTIRVDVEHLDSIMNLVGELVIDQTRIAQVGNLLRDRYSTDETIDDLERISNHFSRIIGELQESVMKTRMLPVERLFNRFPRMVRDLARTLNKEVNLLLEGKETELDRTVIEEISDPLIHLIRNAIDHGIEEVEVRKKRGKSLKGTIKIRASHQENQVVLTVEDDGAGINAEKVKESAIRKQLITAQDAEMMSEQEWIQLIFLPGFSTAQSVSDISGRGVGMDIVRNHIEKLNGLIDVETRLGEGTKFTIKLPLTLAILRGLLIKLQETTYALPMNSVIEIVRISKKEIHSVKGQAVVKIREKILPLIGLHDLFRMSCGKRKTKHVFIVVVGLAEKRLGLVVDELIGSQEIVVKSIGSYIGQVEGVSGATILGDGSVALILDVTGVFKLANNLKSIESEVMDDVV
ncbi:MULTISPECIES: chemotaxis protein CheA [Paenibacillus]|uniref:Chemotaxis protein CheA n=1 Tax=Paenibacillus naphthalenovorans TaxID=162209 RepID=A0A0U2WFH2_9BACL|nr:MULTISPECIES: chemotaxis protein CheA [Paenibacillus]ALS25102.1 chemotaxis protein CheA [Paenibacillus naphthalenovorans]GCL73210.1 chemotaxis protein CheA [Paenibacillus naphthalenovorans]SDI35837.1 two-component system, chemotaxis family, sensor kinase CheA [Paenibacillus naphthalenovorans]